MYVFVLDRTVVPGAPRVLKTRLNPSPYVVIRPLWTTTLVQRLADGYTTLYSNTDLKIYEGSSPLFNTVPVEVSKVLLHSFADLLAADLTTLTRVDTLNLPNAVQLFEPDIPDQPVEVNEADEVIQLKEKPFTPLDEQAVMEQQEQGGEPEQVTQPDPDDPPDVSDQPVIPDDEDEDYKTALRAAEQEQVEADVSTLLTEKEVLLNKEPKSDEDTSDNETLEVIYEQDEENESLDDQDNIAPATESSISPPIETSSQPRRSTRNRRPTKR